MINKVRKDLFELQDKKYKEFHSGLCPNTDNIIGVRVPILRDYAKKLIKETGLKYLEEENLKYYEEIMLQGMIIGLSKLEINEVLKNLEKFIPKIDNWSVCDVTCAGLKVAKKYPAEIWNFLDKYLKSENEFEIRFSLVMYLDFFLTDEYIDRIFERIDKITHGGYYVKMAIAWLISCAYIKQKEKTSYYLENNNLDKFTYNKSIQKIIESYRVSNEEKEYLRKKKKYD